MVDDPLDAVQRMFKNTEERKQMIEKLEESFSDLDTTLNIKVNSSLRLNLRSYKSNHSNLSRELKFLC